MAYPHQLERFVARYLINRTAEVVQPSYGILEAVVDEQLGRQLQSKSGYIKIAFDYEAAQEDPDAQYVTYSSKFLETLVGLAVRDHFTVIRYCPSKTAAPPALAERAAAFQNTTVKNVTIIDQPKAYFAPCLRFKFKLAYLCDEREEELCQLWIDGHSGKPIEQYSGITHIFFTDAPDQVKPELTLRPLDELFFTAARAVDAASAERRVQLESRIISQRDADLERTDAYFGSMIEDLQFKLSKAKSSQDSTQEQQISGKLQAVMLQKQHHVRDLNEKHRIRCEASLLDAALYMVPRWRTTVHAAAGKEHALGSQGILWWDEILRGFLD